MALFCRKRPEDHEENVGDECTHNKDNEESVLERSITRGDESDDAFESSNGISTRMAILKSTSIAVMMILKAGSKSSHAAKPDHTWMPWTGLEANVVGPHGKIDAEVTIDFPEQITSSDLSATAPTVIRVLCKTAGRHWLNVTFEGEHVVGSPFEINALVGLPAVPPGTTRCPRVCSSSHGSDKSCEGFGDKFGNRCFLDEKDSHSTNQRKSEVGIIERKSVRLLINGSENSSCYDGGSDHTMSLLFKLKEDIFLSSVNAFKSLLLNKTLDVPKEKTQALCLPFR